MPWGGARDMGRIGGLTNSTGNTPRTDVSVRARRAMSRLSDNLKPIYVMGDRDLGYSIRTVSSHDTSGFFNVIRMETYSGNGLLTTSPYLLFAAGEGTVDEPEPLSLGGYAGVIGFYGVSGSGLPLTTIQLAELTVTVNTDCDVAVDPEINLDIFTPSGRRNAIKVDPSNVHLRMPVVFQGGAQDQFVNGVRVDSELFVTGAFKHTGSTAGFFGATPVSRAAALTQTYSTADRTLAAYTADDESSAYTGAADGEAKLADLNALRVAYENLRAFVEDVAQFVNALVDDMQAYGLEQ